MNIHFEEIANIILMRSVINIILMPSVIKDWASKEPYVQTDINPHWSSMT